MKIKLTKRGRNVVGIAAWTCVVIASVFTAVFLANLAQSSDISGMGPQTTCSIDTVRQSDGSCTNQE